MANPPVQLLTGILDPNPPVQAPAWEQIPAPAPGAPAAELDQNLGVMFAAGGAEPIVFVREVAGGGGTDSMSSSDVGDGAFGKRVHDYSRHFLVRTTGPGVGVMSVRLAVDPVTNVWIPRIASTYISYDGNNTDEESFAHRIVPRQDGEDPQTWAVDVEYSSDAVDWDFTSDNPLDTPVRIGWDSEEFEVALQQDATGAAVVNSAGDAFDPPPNVKRAYLALSLVRNESDYDPVTKAGYVNTVNGDAFYGFVPGQVWCRRIGGQRCFHNGVRYWKVSYSFLVDTQSVNWLTRQPTGWQLRVLDQGYRELVGNVRFRIQNQGVPASQPAPLDGAGRQLASGGTLVFRTFTPYPSKNFGDLNLS